MVVNVVCVSVSVVILVIYIDYINLNVVTFNLLFLP